MPGKPPLPFTPQLARQRGDDAGAFLGTGAKSLCQVNAADDLQCRHLARMGRLLLLVAPEFGDFALDR